MRFVGLTEVASFLAEWPNHAEPVRAWLAEIKHRRWTTPSALAEDFRNVDASGLPVVVFYLSPINVRINTLVDFRIGLVLLTAIEQHSTTMTDRSSPTRNAYRDH